MTHRKKFHLPVPSKNLERSPHRTLLILSSSILVLVFLFLLSVILLTIFLSFLVKTQRIDLWTSSKEYNIEDLTLPNGYRKSYFNRIKFKSGTMRNISETEGAVMIYPASELHRYKDQFSTKYMYDNNNEHEIFFMTDEPVNIQCKVTCRCYESYYDEEGRRVGKLGCFVIFVALNLLAIGLALFTAGFIVQCQRKCKERLDELEIELGEVDVDEENMECLIVDDELHEQLVKEYWGEEGSEDVEDDNEDNENSQSIQQPSEEEVLVPWD